MKLTYEDKIKIIEMIDKGIPMNQIAQTYQLDDSTVLGIKNKYFQLGVEGLKRNKYTIYTQEFKLSVIKNYWKGIPLQQLAIDYNIPNGASTIYRWIKEYEKYGIDALAPKKRGRKRVNFSNMNNNDKKEISGKNDKTELNNLNVKDDELKKARYEIEYLRAENDYLKKLQAAVLSLEKNSRKKKSK
ncbi:transposase [Mycoplasma testudineum]|uniref:Transposase n=1 Tax=Mycoplasma testudineum TaxID=244584 RepID=A0A4R6IH79_9MOLU|nr:helix-turn-helix domain-containing protein [Mycoplasma testudineum]TDO21221.1 transposase [Mycoplasma testudineum]